MKYALIRNNIVVNIIVWDGISEYSPNGELIPIDENDVGMGYTYQNNEFVKPEPQEAE